MKSVSKMIHKSEILINFYILQHLFNEKQMMQKNIGIYQKCLSPFISVCGNVL